MSIRGMLVVACVLSVASPALASGSGRSRPKSKRMKVTTVVDKTVDGVVVERKVFLRRGGSTRKAKKLSLESQANALGKGNLVSDQAAPIPASLTDKGRLIEKEGSYRERVVGARRSAVITLVRPGARHFSGPEAKVVYAGGRARRVTKTGRPARGRAAARRDSLHSRGGLQILNFDALQGAYIEAESPASLSTRPGSDAVHLQGELHGLLVNWDLSRQLMEGALRHGGLQDQEHNIQANERWVSIQLRAVPTAVIALKRQDVERFLSESNE